MSIKAPGYNVSAAVSAGFVKNDGAGNFSFGELGGGGAGGGDLELLETILPVGGESSITFSGLNGDVDKCYKLIWTAEGPGVGIDQRLALRPNAQVPGAGGSAHKSLRITTSAQNGNFRAVFNEMRFSEIAAQSITGELTFAVKTGQPRVYKAESANFWAAATFALNQHFRYTWTGSWEDGAGDTTNITSLQLFDIVGTFGFTAGSRYSLYRVNS